MWGISVASGTPASSAASAGARVRMSLTTTCGPHLLEQRQQRPRRLGGVLRPPRSRGRAAGTSGIPRRRRSRARRPRPRRAAPPRSRPSTSWPRAAQRPAQRDRREDVPGVAEGGDQDAQALRRPRPSGAVEPLAGAREDDLRARGSCARCAAGSGPPRRCPRAGSSPRPGPGPWRTRSSACRRSPAPAPCTGCPAPPTSRWVDWVKLITAALVAA